MLREIVENLVNEGTQGAFIVLEKGIYKVSLLQYDGYESYVVPILKKKFKTSKDAKKLVAKTGEIRGIDENGKVEYYSDRKLLITTKNERTALEEANYFASYKYFWDGESWRFFQGSAESFDKFRKI